MPLIENERITSINNFDRPSRAPLEKRNIDVDSFLLRPSTNFSRRLSSLSPYATAKEMTNGICIRNFNPMFVSNSMISIEDVPDVKKHWKLVSQNAESNAWIPNATIRNASYFDNRIGMDTAVTSQTRQVPFYDK